MKPFGVSASTVHAESSLFKRILVAVDGSRHALRAGRLAVKLAKRNGAELIVVSVVPRPAYFFTPVHGVGVPPIGLSEYYDFARKDAEKWVDAVASIAKNEGVKVTAHVLTRGTSVVKSIADFAADRDVDLTVVGRRGVSGFKRLLIGSVSSSVVTHAPSSVLVVR